MHDACHRSIHYVTLKVVDLITDGDDGTSRTDRNQVPMIGFLKGSCKLMEGSGLK